MEIIEYILTSPEKWYQTLHSQIPSVLENDQLIFNKEIGQGKLQYTILQNGLWMHQMNFKFNKPLHLYRKSADTNDFFTLDFHLTNSAMSFKGGDHTSKLGIDDISILLNSATADMKLLIPAQKNFQIINIGFTRKWLLDNLLIHNNADKLGKLFLSNQPIYISESLDFKFKSILKKLSREDTGRLGLFSNTLQLLEYMANRLNERPSSSLVPANIHHEDFQQLLRAKSLLSKKLDESIPVDELAQEAGMSLSKFKRLFKQVFGTTPYKHYLENRMEKAMEMLTLGKHTISEIGFLIGYTNLSQFSKAFKKHHGVLPSETR